MGVLSVKDGAIYFSRPGEMVKISACAEGCIRFQASPNGRIIDQNWNLIPQVTGAKTTCQQECAVLETGTLKAVINTNGKVCYYRSGVKILEEHSEQPWESEIRPCENRDSGLWKVKVSFKANTDEHFYGLGHGATGCFDMKGCSIELKNVNARCSIPFVYSSLGYGFLWNNPAVGNCELAANKTCWSAEKTKQIDYVVMEGNPKEVLSKLADLTGHSPKMPHWATGFWQCKLRYESQEQLLESAREHIKRNIPISAIIIDYFHWTEQGDYKFDPVYWPDPKAMADELHEMGIKLMISMWPTINPNSENYQYMAERNMLLRTTRGQNCTYEFYGKQTHIDPSNPETREYVWQKLKENYIDNGVDCFWFDEAEPGINPCHWDNLVFSIGNGDEVGLLFPYYYSQMVYDGMKAIGRADENVTLARAAWVGSQKFGTLVWSGDIPSTFESLSDQIKSGLNMAMCAIPWWTTDIGGFYGADTESAYFRELIVRWFQYGVFCPVTRLHGSRNRIGEPTPGIKEATGGPNEIWRFGERNYAILKDLVLLRERLRPYVQQYMDIASEKGYPVMRPMFFEYPEDENCYMTGEQYMFGSSILFAPISVEGSTEKTVYLPKGDWVLTKDHSDFAGEQYVTVSAAIDEFVAFVKKGDPILVAFENAN
ncbi:MAG: hypothetical protein GX096_02435 [Clostridiales bacterium]|nr:hypothetical protein [Clostridiales bacterium]